MSAVAADKNAARSSSGGGGGGARARNARRFLRPQPRRIRTTVPSSSCPGVISSSLMVTALRGARL